MTETPHLDRLPAIGTRAPWMCTAGWCSHLLSRAPGHTFIASIKALCVQSRDVEVALIIFNDGLAYTAGLN